MMSAARRMIFCLLTTLTVTAFTDLVSAAEANSTEDRFEVSSVKMVRQRLVETIAALERKDIPGAKEAFDAYDSGWNGIEVYINIRSKVMYEVLELELQAKIAKALAGANPDVTALLADAQTMLAKYDQTIDLVQKGAPLNPLYDDVARLRIVRASLREVNPALKAGNIAKARASYDDFQDGWFNIEDFVRSRSLDAYVDIEKGMVHIDQGLQADKPNAAEVAALVNAVMAQYNAVVTEVQKEARSAH
jgi:hypothetical protein